ncbi:MAG TPA: hypothetical protein VI197_05495 [Polyangiaceae bacterium]
MDETLGAFMTLDERQPVTAQATRPVERSDRTAVGGAPRRLQPLAGSLIVTLFAAALAAACGEEGLLPTTVDPGPDFNVSLVLFDENFYYCQIEPMLFAQGCGPGNAAEGDPSNGCHHSVTSYRLIDYSPRVAEGCSGNSPGPGTRIPDSARQNYQLTQARMKRDPEAAPLLLRPTGQSAHPRTIFSEDSAEADLIRQWANQFSSQ